MNGMKSKKLLKLIEKALDEGVEIKFASHKQKFELMSVYSSDTDENLLWFDIQSKKE